MPEGAVGFAHHAGEVGVSDGVAGEKPDYVDGHLGIGPAGKARDRCALELRPRLRHVETAVAGEAREHHLGEAQARGFPACGDVAQATTSKPRGKPPGRKILIFQDIHVGPPIGCPSRTNADTYRRAAPFTRKVPSCRCRWARRTGLPPWRLNR